MVLLGECPGGWTPGVNESGFAACIPCPPGNIRPEGDATCSPCDRGSAPNAEQIACLLCGPGTYAAVGALPSCEECPAGLATLVTAGADQCFVCPTGWYAE